MSGPVLCGRCQRHVDDHAVRASSPEFFDSCSVVISSEGGGVVFRWADGVICTMTWPG